MPDDIKIEVEEETSDKASKKEKKKVVKLEEELATAKAEAEKWKNEYYRAYADTKNLRSSLEKEHQNAIKYRAEGFIDELLPVLDSFHMALANEPTDAALKAYLTGFQYIYKNLVTVLENEGVTEITPALDKPFDASLMNAVDTVEVENDKEANLVKKIYAKGYKLHDRLIRPAMVTVSKKKEEKKADEKPTEEKIDA